MIEELKNKIGKIPNNRDSELSKQFDSSMKAIKEMKKNIDNIIFYKLQKEIKKNDEILINTELDNSSKISMMRTLTELNILPLSNDNINIDNNSHNDNNNTPEEKYLLFLLSKFKLKNIPSRIEPLDFWKILLKYKGLEEYKKNE